MTQEEWYIVLYVLIIIPTMVIVVMEKRQPMKSAFPYIPLKSGHDGCDMHHTNVQARRKRVKNTMPVK